MRRIACVVVMLLIQWGVPPAVAQDCGQSVMEFQNELEWYVADLYAASDLAAELEFPAADDFHGAVLELDASLAELTDEDLERLCVLFVHSPSLAECPRTLIDMLRISGDAPESGGCPDPVTRGVVFGMWVVFQAASMVAAGASDIADCVDNDLVPGSGAICGGIAAFKGVTDGAAWLANFALEEMDGGCLDEHYELLKAVDTDLNMVAGDVLANRTVLDERVDVRVSSRAGQESVDGVSAGVAVLDAKLGAPNTDIATDLRGLGQMIDDHAADREVYQDLDLRLAIETILQPGQTGRIATFQMPRAVGGQLEQVREVVALAISMSRDTGEDVRMAMWVFNEGDFLFNTGHYPEAFDRYRLAYRQVVEP